MSTALSLNDGGRMGKLKKWQILSGTWKGVKKLVLEIEKGHTVRR